MTSSLRAIPESLEIRGLMHFLVSRINFYLLTKRNSQSTMFCFISFCGLFLILLALQLAGYFLTKLKMYILMLQE